MAIIEKDNHSISVLFGFFFVLLLKSQNNDKSIKNKVQ